MGIGQFHNRRVSKKYFQIGIFQKKIVRLRPHVEDNHFIEVVLLGLPGNPYFSFKFWQNSLEISTTEIFH